MPFDSMPKDFETVTKTEVFSRNHFVAWLKTRDGAETYDYANPYDCILCRYAIANGLSSRWPDIMDASPPSHPDYDDIRYIAYGGTRLGTVSDALTRARHLLSQS